MIKGQFLFNKDKKDNKKEFSFFILKIFCSLLLVFGFYFFIHDDFHSSSNIMIEQYHMLGGKEDINQFIKEKSIK